MADPFNTKRNNPDSLGRTPVAISAGAVPDGVKVVYSEVDGTCTVTGPDGDAVTNHVVKAMVPLLGVPASITAFSGMTRFIGWK